MLSLLVWSALENKGGKVGHEVYSVDYNWSS